MNSLFGSLGKLSDSLNTLCKWIGGIFLAGMVVLIVIQVAARYVFGSSLSWSEEISRYLFIWVVMIGTIIGVHDGSHVAVEFLLKMLPNVLYKFVNLIYTLCLCLLACVMVWFGFDIAASVATQLSPATRIPMSYVYTAVPVCACIMLIHLLAGLFKVKEA